MAKSKEFKEGYEAGFNGESQRNPYREDPQVLRRNDWRSGYVYGNNDRRANAEKRTFNSNFQNGRQKALNAIGVKLENGIVTTTEYRGYKIKSYPKPTGGGTAGVWVEMKDGRQHSGLSSVEDAKKWIDQKESR